MHMSDALVSPATAAAMYIASSATAVFSVKKVRLENDIKKIPMMGVLSAFVFAAQMVNFAIPGTGSSGHFSGALLLSILLGPYAGFLSMISVLAIQCLLFADGGILTLGCNIWNMAFYSCFIGYLCIYRPLVNKNMKRGRILFASILASVISLQLGAFSVVLETLVSGISALSFGQFILWMQPIHLAIGIVEGLITGAVVIFVLNTRPELLQNKCDINKAGFRQTLIILTAAVVLIAGGLSLFSSKKPDGLEWSIRNMTGVTKIEREVQYQKTAGSITEIQEKTAILPDYSFKGSSSKTGTIFSGLFGIVIVTVISVGCGLLFRLFRRKKNDTANLPDSK